MIGRGTSTKRLLVLGSTGSVGVQALEVAESDPDEYAVEGLAVDRNTARLAEQVKRFRPDRVAIRDRAAGEAFRRAHGDRVRVYVGEDALTALCRDARADIAVAAVVGIAGLPAVLMCIVRGMTVALANKEALVAGGALVIDAARRAGVQILPVDSEHSAIFQCLQGPYARQEIARILLTASGGPFRGMGREQLSAVTAADALRHPTWRMGAKITVDSATLMNKGLEVIEAHHLFGLPPDRIDVLVHPSSIVHSLVEFHDGAVLAQMGVPDMAVPIRYALSWPRRKAGGSRRLDLTACGPLSFEPPDTRNFPCLALAYQALRQGADRCVVLNAANEVAVALFLKGRLRFTGIAECVEWALEHVPAARADSLEAVLALDLETRRRTQEYCEVHS
ncbi:MAG: 1-deoxy-D-xylulose-5-phosphate reductoisomerase [Christensenellales bacterium]|jgi:1-deoxy-D-xylulose-5-phosphate reductoisomerase